MPSPIAHLGTGYAIYRISEKKLNQDRRRLWVLPLQMVAVAGLSLLPDLDVILAFIYQDMRNYHNQFSHSLFFAVPASLLCAAIFTWMYRSRFWTWFLVSYVSYAGHIFLDMLTGGRGVMLFWPLSETRFNFPVTLFYGVQWGLGWISVWHLWTLFTEAIYLLVLFWIIRRFPLLQKPAEPNQR